MRARGGRAAWGRRSGGVRRPGILVVAAVAAVTALAFPAAARGQADAPPQPIATDGEVRVLFIGNSLTYTNDLPGMLASLLDDAGVDATVASLAHPNFGLQDHWEIRATHERIAEGWDVVVLQQGPSATEGRPSLLEYSERFDGPIRAAGAVPALFMVWPSEARSFDFEGVSESYAMAANLVEGLLFPAGEAWLDAWDLDASTALYGPDGFHPAPLGTYAAALVIVEQITGADARDVEGDIPGRAGSVSPEALAVVREAAHRANLEHRRAHD